MATSPSDQNNKNILAWLDRLQESARNTAEQGAPKAYQLDNRPLGNVNDHEPEESEDSGEGDGGDQEGEGDKDTLRSQSLPDSAVPLGLIANLSLSSNKAKAQSVPGVAREGEENDDDVVSVFFFDRLFMLVRRLDFCARESQAQVISCLAPPPILGSEPC